MQQQQTDTVQQQNGTIAKGQPPGGGGGSPHSPPGSYGTTSKRAQISGGRFDFEDGGTYCGGWEDGKAHGHGVCTGPKHQGAYAGAWTYGFEVSGVYIWPSGSHYEGQWQNGRRHGLGVEQRGRLIYRGEWSNDGHKGRYGVRQSTTSTAKFEGTWNKGFQDGYGVETYADGGSYQGQWQEGKRHGYGIRTSAPFGLASHYRPKTLHTSMSSLKSNENHDPSDKRNSRMDEVRGGFVLTARSDDAPARRNSLGDKSKKGFLSGLKMRKQRSTGDLEKRGTMTSGSIRSTMSTASWISTGSSQSNMTSKSIHTESNASFTLDEDQLDPSIVETYMGEWKKDKRDGFGIAERSDGLRYEGEWFNNKKHGYGITYFRGGSTEEGKYKNNILISSQKKKNLFLSRSRKFSERIQASVSSAQRASKMALQRADIAISRTATARSKAEAADLQSDLARMDCEAAVTTAREFAPDFKPTVLERFEKLKYRERYRAVQGEGDGALLSKLDPSALPSNRSAAIDNQNQSLAFHQQSQAGLARRASQLNRQNSMEFPVPSSMYSQMPVKPQTDLTHLVSQHQQQLHQQLANTNANTTSSGHNQVYNQPPQHQQTNPAYQFQQQQPQQPAPAPAPAPPAMNSYGGQQQAFGSNYSNSNGPQQAPQQPQDVRSQMYGGYEQQQMQQQQQQQQQMDAQNFSPRQSTIRRNSRPTAETGSGRNPMLGSINQQSSIDHFDHYKRPPSRDNSVDRYARAASRLSGGLGSRQASIDRNAAGTGTPTNPMTTPGQETPNRGGRAGSVFRGSTPGPQLNGGAPPTGNGSVPTGTGMRGSRAGTPSFQKRGSTTVEPMYSAPNQPFEDVLLRQRTLGQDIIPSPSQPKRTESLYMPPKPAVANGGGGGGAGGKKLKSVPISVTLQRKKSLPGFEELPRSTEAMSREEVSALGSARREEVRRQIENNERLKANPLLYLVSPQVKDWFSRQQLVLLVLVVNIFLAIMFFKMLT